MRFRERGRERERGRMRNGEREREICEVKHWLRVNVEVVRREEVRLR